MDLRIGGQIIRNVNLEVLYEVHQVPGMGIPIMYFMGKKTAVKLLP